MSPMIRYGAFLPTALLLVACGGSHNPRTNQNGDSDVNSQTCTSDANCTTGRCIDGFCKVGETCESSAECAGSDYCHFPSAPDPWVEGTGGACDRPCSSDDSCGVIGQQCIAGHCYTNISCNPSNANHDCPPGEVCNRQSRSCSAPKDPCISASDCPAAWVCNSAHKCVDPANQNLGSCTTDAQCATVTGCSGGSCTCNGGRCQPRAGCSADSQCGTGQVCNGGICENARACSEQSACTPYSLVCTGGYCRQPTPCGAGNTCQNGYVCKTNYNPPACFPPNTADCTRNEQCPDNQRCDAFAGRCVDGCRDNTDCVGQCNGSVPCNCNSQGACTTQSSTGGGSCTDQANCGSGTVCVYNDPSQALMCDLGLGTECAMSCHVQCDLALEMTAPTCPSGTVCGGSDQMSALIAIMLQQLMGTGDGSTVSACYH